MTDQNRLRVAILRARAVNKAVADLTPRRQAALEAWLKSGDVATIAKEMKMTREHVRQILESTLKELQAVLFGEEEKVK